MSILFRKRIRLGPVRVNASNSGLSYTVKVGPWSWNTRARRHRVDLPGPFSWRSDRRPARYRPGGAGRVFRRLLVVLALAGVGVAAWRYGHGAQVWHNVVAPVIGWRP
jgi:hypothetical protein